MDDHQPKLSDLITELRRLESLVLYFENRILETKITIEEFARITQVRSEAEPAPATAPKQRFKHATDEELTQLFRKHTGNFSAIGRELHCPPSLIYYHAKRLGLTLTEQNWKRT